MMQVGLAEMQTAVEQTGGLLVQASTFNAQAFKESFRRIFAPPTEEGHLGMNSNAQFEVRLLFNKAPISFLGCWLQAHCPSCSRVVTILVTTGLLHTICCLCMTASRIQAPNHSRATKGLSCIWRLCIYAPCSAINQES